MIRIGICDDQLIERENMTGICKEYLEEISLHYEFIFFSSGEEKLMLTL